VYKRQHDNSPRAAGPFVEINCAAMQDSLVENELFGAERGAHATAYARSEGKVAAAQGGTLVLDEVGLLSMPAQTKLLQLLQSRQYYPLGAPRPVQADVRIIAATNADLRQAVAEKAFREDLYFRLEVVPIRMPDLAERREDVADLAVYLCGVNCERHRLPRLELSRGALYALENAAWPGNIRQLGHAVERAAIRAAAERCQQIEAAHVFPHDGAGPGAAPGPADDPAATTFQEATRRFQMQLLQRTLHETDWNVVETAKRLDLARSHVYNLIRAFGLTRGA
jgi:Nif-specific regulatory protein